MEKLNAQMDNGQTYRNRAVVYSLQKAAQETNLYSVTTPGSQLSIFKSDLQEVRPLSLATIQKAKQ